MFNQSIGSVLDPKKFLLAAPDTSVSKAAKMMVMRKVSAVMIAKGARLVGIFTERDAVRVIATGRDVDATVLSEVMTPDPKTVSPDETIGYAMLLMHENGVRHAPVVENGRPVGIVSARNALDPELEEFASDEQRRRNIRRYSRAS